MRKRFTSVSALIFLLAFSLFTRAQVASKWRGLIVHRPEEMSGAWEAKDGAGVVGLEICLSTAVGGKPVSLQGVDQRFLSAEIVVYERHAHQQSIRDGDWFEDNSAGVDWEGYHLRIRSSRGGAERPMALDLIFDPVSSIWKGHYQWGAVDRDVILTRPNRARHAALSPFVGTWTRSGIGNNCLHIAQAVDGGFVAWSDDLVAPGVLRYANGLQAPTRTVERFGSIALLDIPSERSIKIELKAFSALCCSIISGGTLTRDSRTIQTSMEMTEQHVPQSAAAWTRVRGDSCIYSNQ